MSTALKAPGVDTTIDFHDTLNLLSENNTATTVTTNAVTATNKAPPVPAAAARKRRKAIITSQRHGNNTVGVISVGVGPSTGELNYGDDDDDGQTEANDSLADDVSMLQYQQQSHQQKQVDDDVTPTIDTPSVETAAACAAALHESLPTNSTTVGQASNASLLGAASAPAKFGKLKVTPGTTDHHKGREEEADGDDDVSHEFDDADNHSESGGAKAQDTGQSESAAVESHDSMSLLNSRKAQIRYDPVVPMEKEQLAAWRREARRVRNRESAAASRQRIRGRISELEDEVHNWKQKYFTALEQFQNLERHQNSEHE